MTTRVVLPIVVFFGYFFWFCADGAMNSDGPALAPYDEELAERIRTDIFGYLDTAQYAKAQVRLKELIDKKTLRRDSLAMIFCRLRGLDNPAMKDSELEIFRALDWRDAGDCGGHGDIAQRILEKGMDAEVDLVLTRGTALANDVSPQDENSCPGGCPMGICPERADYFFSFWGSSPRKTAETIARYEQELKKRPRDVRLIVEYAYQLSKLSLEHRERAQELLSAINLESLTWQVLMAVGTLGSWEHPVWAPFKVKAFEQALKMPMIGDATIKDSFFVACTQVPISFEEQRGRMLKHMLKQLGQGYVHLQRYSDAARVYAEYLSMPQVMYWEDRTPIEKTYAEVMRSLGGRNNRLEELEKKARDSKFDFDWADLASYHQWQGNIDAASSAWRKAIELSPPDPGYGSKLPRRKGWWRNILAKMLSDNHRYEEESAVWKEAFSETIELELLHRFQRNMVLALVNAGQKPRALEQLMRQLDYYFDKRTALLLLQTDHESSLRNERWIISGEDAVRLPSWPKLMERISRLPKDEQFAVRMELFGSVNMHAKFVREVESSGQMPTDYKGMNGLREIYRRIGQPAKAAFWAQEILKHIGEKGFPAERDYDYRELIADIGEDFVMAGDFKTALDFAKKATLQFRDTYEFPQALARLASRQGRKEALIKEFEDLAAQHPGESKPWKVMAQFFEAWNDEAGRVRCGEKAAAENRNNVGDYRVTYLRRFR